MIRKLFFLIVLFSLVNTSAAFCETSSFKVSVTIPRIVGVNYFPEATEIASSQGKKGQADFTEQVIFRNGQEVLLKTHVEK